MGATHLLFHNQGRGRPIGGGNSSTGTAAFSPLDIAGLQLWLDGSDIATLFQDSAKTTPVTSDGDVVGAMADKSGNGNDVVEATTANKPIYKTGIENGKSVVRFDGTDDKLTSAGFGELTIPNIIFAVYATSDNTKTTQSILDGNAKRHILRIDGSSPTKWAAYAGIFLTNGNVNNGIALITAQFNGASSFVRLNGSQTNGNTGTISGLDMFKISPAGAYLKGDLCELLFYNTLLTGEQIISIETTYLNSRWAIY